MKIYEEYFLSIYLFPKELCKYKNVELNQVFEIVRKFTLIQSTAIITLTIALLDSL